MLHGLAFGDLSKEPSCQLCHVNAANQQAILYVGSRPSTGRVQLKLLLLEGLQKDHRVLEIGCGALVAGIPIMSYLSPNHYVGIEPNRWLIDASLKVAGNRRVVNQKNPLFIYNMDFDATPLNIGFDYIIAHSIMSHAAHQQLPLFLENGAKVLNKSGKLIFSIRLTEPNAYGHQGAPQETQSPEWIYPGNSFFHKQTVVEEASKWFSHVEHKQAYTQLITSDDPSAFHDWFVLTK